MADYTDYINDYISGALSPGEMKQFEAKLAIDDELNREYLLMTNAMEYIKARSTLEELENNPDLPIAEAQVEAYFAGKKETSEKPEHTSKPIEHGIKVKKILTRAIPAAILIGSFLVIRSIMATNPNTRLYEKYYEPLSREAVEMEMVRGSSSAAMQAGIDCYLVKEYPCAIDHFAKIPEGSFYLGLSKLGMGSYEDAMESLLLFQTENPEHPGVNWYLGLTYLRMGNLKAASDSFERISRMGGAYQSRAERLMAKIEN